MRHIGWIAFVMVAGCTTVRSEDGFELSAGAASAAEADGDSGADAGDGGDDDAIRFDTPDGAEGADDGGQDQGCQGIDFLFVIDSSGSMYDEQTNLINSFAGFIETIEASVPDEAQTFQVLVADTDAFLGDCGYACQLFPQASCGGIPCTPAPGQYCEATLGSGLVTGPGGNPCGVEGSNRYLVDGQPNLASTFSCLAQVGTNGSPGERQMDAIGRALSPELVGPGGCNDGFLRDEAILVITFITDEEDDAAVDAYGGSAGSPSDWYQAVVSAKGDSDDGIVTLGLIGDIDMPAPLCPPLTPDGTVGAEASPRLRQFVELFGDHGLVGSVCAGDYTPFFQQAVEVIDLTCSEYIPPQG